MSFFSKPFFPVAVALCGLLLSARVDAQDVRGRLDGRGAYGLYPVSRVPVTLNNRLKKRTPPVYSDYQGIYFIKDVRPGIYMLEIWTSSDKPLTYRIVVRPDKPVTDIAPVQVR